MIILMTAYLEYTKQNKNETTICRLVNSKTHPKLNLQLVSDPGVACEDVGGALVASGVDVHGEGQGLEDDVGVGGLGVEVDLLAGGGAALLGQVEGPQRGGARDEHLIVHNVLAQARPPAPAERVHALALAEVGVSAQRLLVRRPAGLQVPLRVVVLRVWVDLGHAVHAPAHTQARKQD